MDPGEIKLREEEFGHNRREARELESINHIKFLSYFFKVFGLYYGMLWVISLSESL